jgi:hypothetical protein
MLLLRAGVAEAAIGAEMNIASAREIEIVEMAEMVNKLTGNTAGLLVHRQAQVGYQIPSIGEY